MKLAGHVLTFSKSCVAAVISSRQDDEDPVTTIAVCQCGSVWIDYSKSPQEH